MNSPPGSGRCRVVVCRGCCCGTTAKHPDVDHRAQLARLAALPAQRAALVVTGCLGNCEHSNNIVVIPSPAGRAAGATVVWLTRMLTGQLTEAVSGWVEAGGPGVAAMPDLLTAHRIDAPGRSGVLASGQRSAASTQS